MFDVNEILARLQDGDSVEDVAAEMTKALNAAEQKFQEAKEQAEQAKVQEQKEKDLNELAEIILDAIDKYVSIKCPEVGKEWAEAKLDVAEFRNMIDASLKAILGIKSLFDGFAPLPLQVPKTEPKAPKKRMTADDKIADFLKSMGL